MNVNCRGESERRFSLLSSDFFSFLKACFIELVDELFHLDDIVE